MREIFTVISVFAGAAYCIAFGSAIFMALETQMHWALALIAFAVLIALRIWPALPVLAWCGAHYLWGWSWFWSAAAVLPVCIYIVSYYWTLASDLFHRPLKRQGA